MRGGKGEGSDASEAAEDSAPYERFRTQPTIDAEAWQAKVGQLSKRERRNEVQSGRDRAGSFPTRSEPRNRGLRKFNIAVLRMWYNIQKFSV